MKELDSHCTGSDDTLAKINQRIDQVRTQLNESIKVGDIDIIKKRISAI